MTRSRVELFATTPRGLLYAVYARLHGEFVWRGPASWRCTGYGAVCRDGRCAHIRLVREVAA